MSQIEEVFQRAAKQSALWHVHLLFIKSELPPDLSGLDPEEYRFARTVRRTVFDWAASCYGALRWPDAGGDGTADRGILTLMQVPDGLVPDLVQAPDGTWLTTREALGADTLGLTQKFRVQRRTDSAPELRETAP
ncbi:hypothetical protein [Sagittula sp. MA-2]|jgi:hypothetical protein|uniref:hypothetical protein n=1 Tax=Sagittula sp. MA-2 TaxID=3048007 RepID=UPI0024C22462|nr:hypothetical protein [Sagittula sp. MA-2]WHZ37502.1 hypothetical protein QNI11_10880 [Sagittula sp. MA-2]